MQDTLHIHRFAARHRVHDADGHRVAQAAQQSLLDGELEASLARLSTGDGIVLIRRLRARVHLSAQHGDADNARRWSDTLAASLAHTLQHAGPADLQRFAGRPKALRAFVADMLSGHTARDWAWQRLSLLPSSGGRSRDQVHTAAQRHTALLRLLADEPDEGVPLLRGVLRSAQWLPLIQALDDGELRGLTQSVLARLAGGSGGFSDAGFALDVEVASRPIDEELYCVHADGHAPERPAWFSATQQAVLTPQRAAWALRLACMLDAPHLAARGAAAVDAQLRHWSVAAAVRETTAVEPGPHAVPASRSTAPADQAASEGPATVVDTHEPLSSVADDADASVPEGHTQHGGLLLLTPLLPASGALALLQDAQLWPADALPRTLHALALRLWPIAADDAAALAFCGLPPGAPPPAPLQLNPAQESALVEARRCVLRHLAQRLPEDLTEARALGRVVPRRARLSADPGWIDVHFALRDVSTELRRAALDLDPGFLPWLGVVLRYRYE